MHEFISLLDLNTSGELKKTTAWVWAPGVIFLGGFGSGPVLGPLVQHDFHS